MKRRSKSPKKTVPIVAVSVLIVILCVLVVAAPMLTNWAVTSLNKNSWDNSTETIDTITNNTENPNDLTTANPHYALNTTTDRAYDIITNSYLDYKPNDPGSPDTTMWEAGGRPETMTKFGEPYEITNHDDYQKIVVTDSNGTALSSQELIVNAWTKKTPQLEGVTSGIIVGALAGAAAGSIIPGVGTLIGMGIGALIGIGIGGGIGYYIDNAGPDRLTLFDNALIRADQGDNFNEIKFGQYGGREGYYSETHIKITLPDSTLTHYSPLAVTTEIVTTYTAVIYIRLINGDAELLKIQNAVKTDSVYNGYRSASSMTSLGKLDGVISPSLAHDSFRGLDTANMTADFYRPKISINDNSHVYQVRERRLIATKDLTGIDLHSPTTGYFWIGALVYDIHGNQLKTEIGLTMWDEILDPGNDSCFAAGNAVNIASNHYYTVGLDYVLSTPTSSFISQFFVQYEISGSYYTESLGSQLIEFNNSKYVTAFSYAYNYFYGENQEIHRTIYDCNDKIQIMCDYNSPFYVNETSADFTLRFFMSVNGSNSLIPTINGAFPFRLQLEILNGDTPIISDYTDVAVPKFGIASGMFSESVKAAGIQELKSYHLRITAFSLMTGIFGGSTNYTVYANALYYILKDYNDFRSEVVDLQGLIDSLTNSSDITSGVYDNLREIMSYMKPKIIDLENSVKALKAAYPDEGKDTVKQLEKSLHNYEDYHGRLIKWMESNSPETVSESSALFGEFKGLVSCLQMWYSDSFTEYNSYVLWLKGEHQASQEVSNITKQTEQDYQKRADADKKLDTFHYLPTVVIGLALIMAICVAAVFYYFIHKRIKNKWIPLVLTIVIFGLTLFIVYELFMASSTAILNWLYGWTLIAPIGLSRAGRAASKAWSITKHGGPKVKSTATNIYIGEKSRGAPVTNSIAVFVFMLFAAMIILSYFLSFWYIVALVGAAVIFFAFGYGFSAIGGLGLGGLFWISGLWNSLVSTITGPLNGLLHGVGLAILRLVGFV